MNEYQVTLDKLQRIEYQLRVIEEDSQLDNRSAQQRAMDEIFKAVECTNNAVAILEEAIEEGIHDN